MNSILAAAMERAANLTRRGRLVEAMHLIQSALGGDDAVDKSKGARTNTPPSNTSRTIEATVVGKNNTTQQTLTTEELEAVRDALRPAGFSAPSRSRWSDPLRGGLGDVVQELRNRGSDMARETLPLPLLPDGAHFLTAQFENAAGSRDYRLYIPSCYQGNAMPLIVMLHGCTQSGDDFALGTHMNEVAEERGFLVAYPNQTQAANPLKCWNWFKPADQRRGAGEPLILAGMTQQITRDYAIDQRRIYVAGMSAGGAAAAIMGAAYPDIFAAVGVHSGLPVGVASDLPSALSVMKKGGGEVTKAIAPDGSIRPTIVFHGDRDGTVHPANGDSVIDQAKSSQRLRMEVLHGQAPGGRTFNRTCYHDITNRVVMEMWTIHNAGHAWSGGTLPGLFTDPRGPDASREMVRFFFGHAL